MRKIDQKQRQIGGKIGSNNGFIPSSIRSISSYLRIVSSGASTVASTVRSAASAASTIVERGGDSDAVPDQVLWAGFDKLENEGDQSRQVLLLGYQFGFQVWDVEDANNVCNIVSRYDGAVSFMQILPKPTHSRIEYANSRPLLVICADGSFSPNGNPQGGPTVSGNMKNGFLPTVVWFYSLKSQSYIKELKFRSVVYSVRCSSRVVAVLQAAQVHCFDVATLEREYTILTNPIVTGSSRLENIGLGPLAVGSRWIAYSGGAVALPNTRVTPQHVTNSRNFGSNGSIVAHYAKQSSKQLAVGIVTLGDIGYKKLYPGLKERGTSNGRLPDAENVGMVIVRDVISKSVIAQFKAHDSPIASLCFDPSGTLLVTASVYGHNFNVFRIMPTASENTASYTHLYRLQRGFTNAVIQDISFSVDSHWIMISSSRGTSHLFSISPSGGPTSLQTQQPTEESLTNNNTRGSRSDSTNQHNIYTFGPPITLSPVNRIRSGNNGWKNVVAGPANTSHSGVVASTFHKCKNKNLDLNSVVSKYHMLVFSSSGCVIQYALRVSSESEAVSVTTSESVSGYEYEQERSGDYYDSRLVVEPIQKWNLCHKQNRREREENIDIYGDNGHSDNRKVFPERIENEKNDYFEGVRKLKKENFGFEERNHVYICEAELQMHSSRVSLWSRSQVSFQSLMMDPNIINEVNQSKGEFEIEKIPTHTIEAKSRFLIPAIDNTQITRGFSHDHEKKLDSNIFDPIYSTPFTPPVGVDNNNNNNNGNEENWKVNAGQTPVKEEDKKGFVNNDISSPRMFSTQLENVDNREKCNFTQSELVNNNNILDCKPENQFQDQGDNFG